MFTFTLCTNMKWPSWECNYIAWLHIPLSISDESGHWALSVNRCTCMHCAIYLSNVFYAHILRWSFIKFILHWYIIGYRFMNNIVISVMLGWWWSSKVAYLCSLAGLADISAQNDPVKFGHGVESKNEGCQKSKQKHLSPDQQGHRLF